MYEYAGYDHRITSTRIAVAAQAWVAGTKHGIDDAKTVLETGSDYPTVVIPYRSGTEEYFYYDAGYEAGFEQWLRGGG